MNVEPFVDQYDVAAELYGLTERELRRRDGGQPEPPQRWLASRASTPVGAVTATLRPDDRMFLAFGCRDLAAYGPLIETAASQLRRRLYATVGTRDRESVDALTAAGFAAELEVEGFRIRFDRALAMLKRAWVPQGFSIRTADTVDEDRLFTLDNTLRHDVPGTDGWRGFREWFREELSEAPPFDAAGYLVAVDDHNGEYVGLTRIWRNPDGPHFGLVGVIRQYRNTVIAAALMKCALTAASQWGHETFTTSTSPVNPVTYPRMKRLGAESLGKKVQLVRRQT